MLPPHMNMPLVAEDGEQRGKKGYEAAFLLLLEEFSCDRSERENEVTLVGDLLES